MKRILAGLLTVFVVAGGCTTKPEADEVASPFPGCETLALAPNGSKLPEVTLPCFTGGSSVSTGQLRGPLVVNLWASWCPPCRAELPALQRLSDSGDVAVLGVVTGDTRVAAATLGEESGITFPVLFDADSRLLKALGQQALPVTVFVAADGRATVHTLPLLTDETLDDLLREHLGAGR